MIYYLVALLVLIVIRLEYLNHKLDNKLRNIVYNSNVNFSAIRGILNGLIQEESYGINRKR